jgi:predicted HTH transcriptional regulator
MNLDHCLTSLLALRDETEWVEFKHNNDKPDEIGEYISALANSAALHGKENGYLVWGIEDGTHRVLGTSVKTGLIKPEDPENKSRKHARYVPFWA